MNLDATPIGVLDECNRAPWLLVRIGDLRASATEFVDGGGNIVARERELVTFAGLFAVGRGIVQPNGGRPTPSRKEIQATGTAWPRHRGR